MADQIQTLEAEQLPENVFDASDPKQVNEARIRAGRAKTKRLRALEAIMELKETRRWMNDILVACHIFEPSFREGSSDGTAFREGERNIGNRLLSDIMEACPEQYLVMLKEAKENE